MLQYLGENSAAQRIEHTLNKIVANDIKSLNTCKMNDSTSKVGDLIASYLEADE